MDRIIVTGGQKIQGFVNISGSKNSALPIMAATLLTDEPCLLRNVADLKDIETMCLLLEKLGKKIIRNGSTLLIETVTNEPYEAPYDLVRKMRASICVLGPLIAKRKKAKVSFPGGCVIGPRPIDLHLKVLSELKAQVNIVHGFICAIAPKLKGNIINLKGKFGSSVLGTANAMMSASLAEGKTTIYHAACEPEVIDLANFLKAMGADIKGEGSSVLEIQGAKELQGANYDIIPDRIEAGTYLISGAITGGEITIKNIIPEHIENILTIL